MIRLYENGWSLARLERRFDVSPSTVTNNLRRAGVRLRRPADESSPCECAGSHPFPDAPPALASYSGSPVYVLVSALYDLAICEEGTRTIWAALRRPVEEVRGLDVED